MEYIDSDDKCNYFRISIGYICYLVGIVICKFILLHL